MQARPVSQSVDGVILGVTSYTISTASLGLPPSVVPQGVQPSTSEQEFPTQDMTQGNASDLSDLMEDVDNELSHTNGHSSYGPPFISWFESKHLGLKAAEKMKPFQKEQECVKGLRMCKKRRRRTSFSNETMQFLIHTFEQNTEPSSAEIVEISSKVGMKPVTVKVWFCSQKRIMKRMASGKGRDIHSLKAEIHAK